METELHRRAFAVLAVWIAATGRKESGAAQDGFNDWRWFEKRREGKAFTVRTFDRGMQWFSDNWPDGAVWPDDVPRPAVSHPPVPPLVTEA